MPDWSSIRPWALTILIAAVYYWLSVMIWFFLPRINPITNWLLDTYAGSGLYRPLITMHDCVVNLAIAMPFALIIRNVSPNHRWILVTFAAIVLFLWTFRLVLFDASYFRLVAEHPSTVMAIVISSAALPISLLIFEGIKSIRSAV